MKPLGIVEQGLILSDNATADASTSKHGLEPKATAPAAGLLSVLGIANGETARTDKALFDATNPAALGAVSPGTAMTAARRDHVHPSVTYPTKDFVFQPTAMQPLETTSPGWEVVTFTAVIATVASFDDTSEEYLNGKFIVPANLDTAGTILLDCVVSPKTGAAGKYSGWTFGHASRADGEAITQAYTEVDWNAAITATTGYQSVISGSVSVATAGWAAGDTIYFRLSRDPAVTNDLTGDIYLLAFRVRVPVTG